jgi:hypothetical protein
MDVERVQKINSLALDLMKQGLAETREDAVRQAEKVFHSQDSESYNSMKETMQGVQEDRNPKKQVSNEPELSQDKIKEILEQNTNFIVKKFKEFQDKMEFLQQNIDALGTKLARIQLPTADQIRSKPKEEAPVQQTEVSPTQTAEGKPIHPRSGDYKDEDVSIEKYFYMGNK